MPKEKSKNCWEFMKCKKEVMRKCPAHTTDSGRECWMVADNFSKDGCPKHKNDIKNCTECSWFKKLNPNF